MVREAGAGKINGQTSSPVRTYLVATIPAAAPPSSSSSTPPRLSTSSSAHKNEILDPLLQPYRQTWRNETKVRPDEEEKGQDAKSLPFF